MYISWNIEWGCHLGLRLRASRFLEHLLPRRRTPKHSPGNVIFHSHFFEIGEWRVRASQGDRDEHWKRTEVRVWGGEVEGSACIYYQLGARRALSVRAVSGSIFKRNWNVILTSKPSAHTTEIQKHLDFILNLDFYKNLENLHPWSIVVILVVEIVTCSSSSSSSSRSCKRRILILQSKSHVNFALKVLVKSVGG